MDLRRLRAGELIAGISGLVLLVSLFLPWYEPGRLEGAYFDSNAPAGWTAYAPLDLGSAAVSGWVSLGVLDVILALVALSAIAIPVVTAIYHVPALPLAHQSLTTLFAFLATLLVIGRVLNMPDWADGREWGLWVALAASLGVVAGCLVAIRDERRAPAGRHTDLSGVPVSGPPEIETLPAPRPEGGR